MVQFQQETLVWHLVEGFTEIHYGDIGTGTRVHRLRKLLDERYQLSFARTFTPKPMLAVDKDLIGVKVLRTCLTTMCSSSFEHMHSRLEKQVCSWLGGSGPLS